MQDLSKMSDSSLVANLCEITTSLAEKRKDYIIPDFYGTRQQYLKSYAKKERLLKKLQEDKDALKEELKRRLALVPKWQLAKDAKVGDKVLFIYIWEHMENPKIYEGTVKYLKPEAIIDCGNYTTSFTHWLTLPTPPTDKD